MPIPDSSRSHRNDALAWAGALSLTIVRLPVLLGAKSVLDPIILAMFIGLILWGLGRHARGVFTNRIALAAYGYALFIAIALVRGANSGAYGSLQGAINQSLLYFLFVLLGILLISTARSDSARNRRLLAIAMAPAAYVVINVVLSFAGLENSELAGPTAGTPATFLKFIGVSSVRTRFPLATSINLFSIVAAVSLVIVVVLRNYARSYLSRRAAWLIGIASLYSILLGDSRGVLFVALVVICLFVLRVRIAGWLAVAAIPLLPLFVLGAIDAIHFLGAASSLSRGENQLQNVSTATGRLLIWEHSWEVLKGAGAHILYGWGAGGHYTSGASRRYAFAFSDNPVLLKLLFTHNALLQMLFDMGIAGLVWFMATIWLTWNTIEGYRQRHPSSPAFALLAALLVVLLCGASEVSPTYYTQEALLTVLLIMGAAAGLASTKRLDTAERSDRHNVTRSPDTHGTLRDPVRIT